MAANFTIKDGVVTGPADYMAERGRARIREIEAGRDVVFNMAPSHVTVEQAVIASLQTDYAAWLGAKQAERWVKK